MSKYVYADKRRMVYYYDNFDKYVDWRDKYIVPPVKDQGRALGCNSGYAYAVISAIEAGIAIQKGAIQLLSPQALIDCDSANTGCDSGGSIEKAA